MTPFSLVLCSMFLRARKSDCAFIRNAALQELQTFGCETMQIAQVPFTYLNHVKLHINSTYSVCSYATITHFKKSMTVSGIYTLG